MNVKQQRSFPELVLPEIINLSLLINIMFVTILVF